MIAPPSLTLRPVQLVSPLPESLVGDLVVELAGGRRIRVAPDFDPDALERLLSVLET